MSVKSKKLRKAARTAAMSALIVSAIVGTSVIASAADNNTIVSSGQVLTVVESSDPKTTNTLAVTGGTVYVGATSGDGFNVKRSGTAASTGTVVTNGGKIFIGQSDASTAVNKAIMTTDNLSITGGEVSVVNSSTLISRHTIDINAGGKLFMAGTAGTDASGSTVKAINVNVNAGGLLHAVQGKGNLINASGAVNLKGGTINVASNSGAALTIGNGSDSAGSDLGAGDLYVTTNGKLNSYGGTIKANLKSAGKTSFKSGTTTVDNLTVVGGTTLIEGNATVNVVEKTAEITGGGVLEMKGGTLSVANGAGTLKVTGKDSGNNNNSSLIASGGKNFVNAGVLVDASGVVAVKGAAELTVTGKLHVTNGATGVAITQRGTLYANTLVVGKTAGVTVGSDTEKGTLSTTVGSLMTFNATTNKWDKNSYNADNGGSGVVDKGIKLGDAGTNAGNGTLILSGFGGKTLTDASFDSDAWNGVDGEKIKYDSYEGNNVIFKDGVLTGASSSIAGDKSAAAPVTLTLTSSAISNGATITAPSITTSTGNLEIANNSTLRVDAAAAAAGVGTTTTLGELTLTGTGAVSVASGATLNTGTLEMGVGSTVEVLNSTANFGTLKATGGTIFVDPAYVTINSIADGFGAKLLTGAGSVVAIGSANTAWLEKPMTDAGFKFGDTTQAVLGVSAADTIVTDATGGVIIVDPTVTNAGVVTRTKADGTTDTLNAGRGVLNPVSGTGETGVFYAGAGSLTVLDVAALDGDAVFDFKSGNTEYVNIVNGAKLHIANLTVKGVQVFENTGTGGSIEINDGLTGGGTYEPADSNAGWAGNNLIQPDRMLTNVGMSKTGQLTADAALASNALGMSHEFNDLMGGVWGNALNNTNSGSAGIRFVSRAASTDYGLSTDQAAKTIEGAAQMGAVAGVQGVTMGAANAATSAVATRTSFAQPLMDKTKAVAMHVDTDGSVSLDSGLNAGNGMKNGFALWIMPLYQSNNVWGMDAGSFKSGYSSDLGGVALGADYTINDMFRFGAALNIGAGYSESSGDFNSTDNSFNFWGINLYGGWTMNNFGVTADVGYTGNYNKVEQEVPMALQVPNLKSDINSSAWTAGVKAEYKFETSVMDIIPHVGVRYMGLTTDEYSVKGGGTVFKVDQDHQTIWTFPIGVTLSKTMDTGSGWAFKPQLDLAVIPAAGDVEARSKSRIPGAPGSAEAKMQIVDYVTFDGGVGFDFSNENLSFGLNYNIQASEHRTGHGVFGTVRYEF